MKKSFVALQFLQSVELGGAGYSVVGGPARDGIYPSVPEAACKGWYFDALVKSGEIVVIGEGSEPIEAEAPVKAFSAQVAEEQGTAAIADATAKNVSNAKPPSDEQVAANKAVAKASTAANKATAKAATAKKK